MEVLSKLLIDAVSQDLSCDMQGEVNMKFASDYFLEEEREGFVVQSLMKRAWAAQLEILEEIRTICKRHQIKYFAMWGTLLGAVRHQGFIPWDDDLDIGMLREDYEKFIRYAGQEVPKGYKVITCQDDDYDQLMMRVANSDKITLDKEFLAKHHGFPYVAGVDIFPIDTIPPNKEDEEILLTLLRVTDILGVYWDVFDAASEERDEQIREVERLTGYHFTEDKPVRKQLIWLADRVSAMYWDTESDEVSLMCWYAQGSGRNIPKSVFEHLREVPFENTVMPIPEDYDLVLSLFYGKAYMTPIKNWKYAHDHPYFRGQIEQLRDFYGEYGKSLPQCFDMRLE